MPDAFKFEFKKGIKSSTNNWYSCIQQLGSGGNATTFLVLCTSNAHEGTLFALKVFQRLSDPERRKRFLEEIAFLQKTSHPALMRVYDSGLFGSAPNDFPFVVMEYLPRRLFDIIRANNSSIPERISYALQLLSALAHLANLKPQVVHRDIKPQNIFVKGGSCVLGDFGLMKLLDGKDEPDRKIFKESIGPGMPFFYRTPDLIAYANNKADITTKSDVFQLGLVLAELFTGRNPAVRPRNIMDALEMEALRTIPGSFSGSIAKLLARMLEMDASKREEAIKFLDPWQGLFMSAAEKARELDGRAI